jgi:hypothetical protein
VGKFKGKRYICGEGIDRWEYILRFQLSVTCDVFCMFESAHRHCASII